MKYIFKKKRKNIIIALAILSVLLLCLYFVQCYWVHREGFFVPEYERIALNENLEYETIFWQTGLGKGAVEKLFEKGEIRRILDVQDKFFAKSQAVCKPVFGWVVRSDRISDHAAPEFVDLQQGDILVTLSTHSLGWRHGHAGLVIDKESVLECMTIGKDSGVVDVREWSGYSNFAVLRVKGITKEERQKVVDFAKKSLCGVPYHLLAGLIGEKAPKTNASYFGLQCAYLVWYAYNHFGIDLDSDGGRLVSSYDLLHSKELEIVQIYGMDPRNFSIQ